ncbi:MAG: hypothetical protein CMP57_01255 [Flavobacteriales bacterium]|nr:hypothetical protein [Flavobacteriales bacterium]|tara:strand:- start:78 stop:302 length:225 start_codon:yes stop_codon:yes gene_type:complete
MEENKILFKRKNYHLMLLGVAFIIVGMILMSGGGSADKTSFNPDIFSLQRITVAPIFILIGFVIEVFAIMYKSK